jgi:hypothetical protein
MPLAWLHEFPLWLKMAGKYFCFELSINVTPLVDFRAPSGLNSGMLSITVLFGAGCEE